MKFIGRSSKPLKDGKPPRILFGHGWVHIIWWRLKNHDPRGNVIDQIIIIPFMTPRFSKIV